MAELIVIVGILFICAVGYHACQHDEWMEHHSSDMRKDWPSHGS